MQNRVRASRKIILGLLSAIIVITGVFALTFTSPKTVSAENNFPYYSGLLQDPIVGGCPTPLNPIYSARGEKCVTKVEDWKKAPNVNHLWVEDPEITAQGKADERARQFIYWVLHNSPIDNHPKLYEIWKGSENVTIFLILLVAAISGLFIIVAKRSEYSNKITVWPKVFKVIMVLLYAVFSASIVIALIQISEVSMRFFIEKYGGQDLFNIYFASGHSTEQNYIDFVGYRDLNLRVQESVQAELFLLKITNVTYYVMGIMLLLRKVLLWFLLFVSPFLAILLPFPLIRNTGYIWIGVFFQWLFYGPLFALFLGATAALWKAGIPFVFNFSRRNLPLGYVFPTATNILYGGPAQHLQILNSANYVDTFVEYILTLIMLWSVIFFPWWLLRIFRNDCCDNVVAIKNFLLSAYDKLAKPHGPSPKPPTPILPSFGTGQPQVQKISDTTKVSETTKIKFYTAQEIKKEKTQDIVRSLNMRVSSLKDIARLETDKQYRDTFRTQIEMLKNPARAQTKEEKRQYMLIKNELFSRSMKNDKVAQHVLSVISSSKHEQLREREKFVQQTPALQPVTHIVSTQTNAPVSQVQNTTNNFFSNIAQNKEVITKISKNSGVPEDKVQVIVKNMPQAVNTQPFKSVTKVAQLSNSKREEVVKVVSSLKQLVETTEKKLDVVSEVHKITQEEQTVNNIATQTNVGKDMVLTILSVAHEIVKRVNIQNIDDVLQDTTVEEIATKTNTEKNTVRKVLSSVVTTAKQKQGAVSKEKEDKIVDKVAKDTGADKKVIRRIVKTQLDVIKAPEQNIDKVIQMPEGVSIEEYEDVRQMWMNQYEKGEVPVSENIKSREDWVNNDVVFITNVLNKLLSDDPKLKDEALDQISYIIPAFMINNLSPEQLIAYLKAKLEAAKSTRQIIEKEKEIREKVKKESEEEEFVDVQQQKKKAKAKTMEMKMELSEDAEGKDEEKEKNEGKEEAQKKDQTKVDETETQQTQDTEKQEGEKQKIDSLLNQEGMSQDKKPQAENSSQGNGLEDIINKLKDKGE